MRQLIMILTAMLAAAPALAQDHAHHGHGPADSGTSSAEQVAGPAPNATPNATPNAADGIWGAEAMQASRDALYKEHGEMPLFWLQGDRLEWRENAGKGGYLWDIQGYYGGDIDKFWFKSEGEGNFGEGPEDAEIQALYSRAIAPFFDLQTGVRQDLTGPTRTHAVIGVQGLAPYMFEIDAAAFLSDAGDLTARFEAELDQRITQKLIIQPRLEASFSAQDVPELGIGAGLDAAEIGLRLRYEIIPEFAPYIGVEQAWKLGQSRRYALAVGEDPSVTHYVVGVRFWF